MKIRKIAAELLVLFVSIPLLVACSSQSTGQYAPADGIRNTSPQSSSPSSSGSSAPSHGQSLQVQLPSRPEVAPSDVFDQVTLLGTGGPEGRSECTETQKPWMDIGSRSFSLCNFQSNQKIRILFYREISYQNYEYLAKEDAIVGADGALELKYSLSGGSDIEIVVTDRTNNIIVSSNALASNTVLFPCNSNVNSRLRKGGSARVTITNGIPVRLRAEPLVHSSNVITQISEGTSMEILDGPACNGGWVWWGVEVSGEFGWMAEGDGNSWFLEPWP